MKNFKIISLFSFLVFAFSSAAQYDDMPQQAPIVQTEFHDGPYLVYKDNKVDIITVKYNLHGPKIKTQSYSIQELAEKEIKVRPNSQLPAFSFKIFSYAAEPTFYDKPEKMLVLSDVEGNFEDFTKILRVAGVINKKYEWTYGPNHLLINGDLFDRGTDVMAVLWLCYKLDNESRKHGGKVHITLGNHDEMNMKGDIRYVDSKYLILDSILGVEHKNMFNENTEIGRWLRTKNSIIIIDSSLFVHGGISIDLIGKNLQPEQINQLVRANLGKEKSQMEEIPQFLFGSFGPFWYRGLIVFHEKFKPISPENLNEVLRYFGVKRIIVGHSIVREIIGLHGGKVIPVDVDHPENKKEKRSRALLITNNKYYTINDDGKIIDLPIIEGFGQ